MKREFENSSTNSHEVDDLLISELVDEMLIQNDINELGKEEQNTKTVASTTKEYHNGSDSANNKTTLESGPICLSDDENDDECIIDEKPQFSTFSKLMRDSRRFLKTHFPTNMQLPRLRFYTMLFGGPRYGINLFSFQKRVLVHSISESRKKHLKPAVGDILVSVNETPVNWSQSFDTVTSILRNALERPPVVLLFCENEDLSTLVQYYKNEHEKIRRQTISGSDQKKSEQEGDKRQQKGNTKATLRQQQGNIKAATKKQHTKRQSKYFYKK